MSQAHVEAVAQAFDHFQKTGQPMWDATHADVEIFDYDIPDAKNPYRGLAGMAEWLADFAAAWTGYTMDVERLIDAGDRVVSLFRIRAVGVGSGAAVERGDAIVWTFRDAKVSRIEYFNDQEAALEAVGLTPNA